MTQTLDSFQHEIIAAGNARGRLVYADPMGARKTATTLSWLAQREDAYLILCVVPGNVVDHWISQAETWFPEAVTVKLRGTPSYRVLMHSWINGPWSHPVLVVTTYDTMKQDARLIAEHGFDTFIFDEGHRLKGRTTQVAKCAYALTAGARNVWCVTGTPILNAPEEMWFYLHLLYRKVWKHYWPWVEEHFNVKLEYFGRAKPVRVIKGFLPGHEEIVRRELEEVVIQRDLDELYDVNEHPWIQEPKFIPIDIDLTNTEQHAYDQMAKRAWAKVGGNVVTAQNRLVVTTHLKQLTSDWGRYDSELAHGSKVTAAAGLVHESVRDGHSVVVFVEYKETARRLLAELTPELRGVTYHGDMTPDEREASRVEFMNGNADFIVGTYGSMREGVDGLQYASHHMLLVDLLWVPGLVNQAIGRLRRDGQTKPVQVCLIACRGTIDMTVLAANLRKVNVTKLMRGHRLTDIIYGRVL